MTQPLANEYVQFILVNGRTADESETDTQGHRWIKPVRIDHIRLKNKVNIIGDFYFKLWKSLDFSLWPKIGKQIFGATTTTTPANEYGAKMIN
ncbi:hypothetical protein NQ315_010528 [Exocentrus adspersus]|uniref:Uncharacterized protein n=1 Tax=Exocentrus adspersus TaxID=1586481 RepID=A0AAV8W5B4_9CUCU|nr:hypothetical protein NQ315_010528 [Exocentrus adspersus]